MRVHNTRPVRKHKRPCVKMCPCVGVYSGGYRRRGNVFCRVRFVFKLRIPIKTKVTRPGGRAPPLTKPMGHGYSVIEGSRTGCRPRRFAAGSENRTLENKSARRRAGESTRMVNRSASGQSANERIDAIGQKVKSQPGKNRTRRV